MPETVAWQVGFHRKARKQCEKLPVAILASLDILVAELKADGPERTNWYHYGKIVNKDDMHHCHLNKGKPRYIAVWKVLDRTVQVMEIKYVGTHENADYRRID